MARAADDALAAAVLADWLEDAHGPAWATWLRTGSRWRDLKAAVRPLGLRLRRMDADFHLVPIGPPAVLQEDLAWMVRDPGLLDRLLDTPVWGGVRRVHLASWRSRTAVPRVVERLHDRCPDLTVLEVTGQALASASVAFPGLTALTVRPLAGSGGVTLPVHTLHLHVRSPAELATAARWTTPALRHLTIRWLGERAPAIPAADAEALLGRPLETVALDPALRPALGERVASVGVRLLRERPRAWDADWRRWTLVG